MGRRNPRPSNTPPPWSPAALSAFAWYDVSDLSTLFQDMGQTVPVTTDGDPVGMVLDKSGNGYHMTQSVTSARPIYRTDGLSHWLAFDGITQSLEHVSLPAPPTVSVVMAATVETFPSNFSALISMASAADFQIDAGSKTSGFNMRFNGTALSSLRPQSSTGFEGILHAYCIALNASDGLLLGRVDGVEEYSGSSYNGTLSAVQHLRLFADRSGNQPVGGKFYKLALLPTTGLADLDQTEIWALQ